MTDANTDPTMDLIAQAVTDGRSGNADTARTQLQDLWKLIGVSGDPFHRCTLAHYMADLHTDPAQALAWDVRALDAADAVSEQRVQQHHTNLHIEGFYPSLHLNLADNYRRLGSFDTAREHLTAARERLSALPDDSYGELIRTALDGVATAVENQDTTVRASAPARPTEHMTALTNDDVGQGRL
ncbi:MAG: hypothetical protein WBD41_11485 [Rhodococcus sp. (in: high G+C Gram-positive bacteria)]|jgi:hypothetical protein|uniref:hypothetical protein n=2 Tax=Bacteria TaxID=2 RepID=UPI0002ACE773|nr:MULTISPECIES: hypothetical protein [unclassified Rhodococcus (in: high G+C Gram-positive bacteria)]CCQ18279.1 putative uncharacterized protein [Rhodococcus sp. AW25M09]